MTWEWSFTDTLIIWFSFPAAFSFLPLVCFSGCHVTAKWGELACRGTGFLGASHYQPNHTMGRNSPERQADKVTATAISEYTATRTVSSSNSTCCQHIQLPFQTHTRQRLWSSGTGVHRAEFSIYGFFYPAQQTHEWLVSVTPI